MVGRSPVARDGVWVNVTLASRGELIEALRTTRRYTERWWRREHLSRLAAALGVPALPAPSQMVLGAAEMHVRYVSPRFRRMRELGIGGDLASPLRRLLRDPVAFVDPPGLFSSLPRIVNHILAVPHFDLQYDLELLEMFEDGPQRLVQAIENAERGGEGPRLSEDAEYRARLSAIASWPTSGWRSLPADALRAPSPGQMGAPPPPYATVRGYLEHLSSLPAGGPAWRSRMGGLLRGSEQRVGSG